MAVDDTVLSRLRGTLRNLFRINDVQLKRESSSAVGARDNTDAGYIVVRGADPIIDDDLVTKRYLDATGPAGSVEAVAFSGGFAAGSYDSVTALSANTTPLRAIVQITTAFDNAGTTLNLGKAGGGPALLMADSVDIEATVVGTYEVDLAGVSWGAGAAAVRLAVGGGVSTAGAWNVQVEYSGAINP